MKKTALIILGVLIIVLSSAFQLSVWADELEELASNGDRVSIFGDIVVDKDTVGDVVVIFGNIEIRNSVKGSVVSIFGNTNVKNKIDGEVVSIMGEVNLDSSVSREVVAVFGKIKMSDRAVVNGDLVAIGSIERSAGAKVFGQEVKVNIAFLMVARAIVTIVLAFLVFILGMVIIAIFKERSMNISAVVEENTGRKIAIGLLGILGFFILMILLSIVVIGPLLYLLLMVVAEAVVSIYFGKQILKVFNANLNVYLEFITGLAAITIMKVILIIVIPQIGFITYLLVYFAFDIFIRAWGIGILIDTKFGTRKEIAFKGLDYNNVNDFKFNIDEAVGNNDDK